MTSLRSSRTRPSSADPARGISRRRFVSLMARLAAVGLAGRALVSAVPGVSAAGSEPDSADSRGWIDLGPSSKLTAGGPAAFPFAHRAAGGDRRGKAANGVIFVTALDSQRLQALSNVCPHQGCRVHWDDGRHAFVCPCQNASFAPDGRVLAGPPQAPLNRFPARVRDGRVQIKLGA